MQQKEPAAFLSYVRSDDDHDAGKITELRRRLEGEIKVQTGRLFPIFQDRNDISWGQQWKNRIDETLFSVTFLIPVVTPSYFQSSACLAEFNTFLIREKTLGENRLILPIYYVSCDEMEQAGGDENVVAKVLRERNWADWRRFRFMSLNSAAIRSAIALMATTVKSRSRELDSIFIASQTQGKTPSTPPSPDALKDSDWLVRAYNPSVPVIRKGRFSEKRAEMIKGNPYYAYTDEFDETITPSKLAEPAEILRLHTELQKTVSALQSMHQDYIRGCTRQLAEAGTTREVAISLLLDNSGSMRGIKIAALASWCSILVNLLPQASVACEVLGFTTRAWKGGRSREEWRADGGVENPGRLNDLRHIVYKAFDETSQESDTNFGLMLREGLLKENVDGEALLWARSRLIEHPAKRKILIVFSDGAPVDDSTMVVNEGSFLDAHLKATVSWIRSSSSIELYGVGIGYNVARYYGEGSPTLNPRDIGPDFLEVLKLAIIGDWSKAASIQHKIEPDAKPQTAVIPLKLKPTRRPRRKPSGTSESKTD